MGKRDRRIVVVGVVMALLAGGFCMPEAVARRDKRVRKRSSLRCTLRPRRRSSYCQKYANPRKPRERFILVSQFPRRFRLCQGKRLMALYRSAHGRRGFDKFREGDKKTPIGTYRITWMAARHEPRRSTRRERRLKRYQIRNRAAWCKPDPNTRDSNFNRKNGPRGERPDRSWRRQEWEYLHRTQNHRRHPQHEVLPIPSDWC